MVTMRIVDLFKFLVDATMTDKVNVIMEDELELKTIKWGDLLKDEYTEYYDVFGYMTETNTLILKVGKNGRVNKRENKSDQK